MSTQNNPTVLAALPVEPRPALRQRIFEAYRSPEPECVPPLVEAARVDATLQRRIHDLARQLVVGLRSKRARSSGVDALMKEFSLSSQEGVALMCLAEALLRVPDKATADRLIRDKLARGDWRAHLGQSPSLFVNAATWGLLITGRLVATRSEEGLASALSKLLTRGGEPLIRKGMDLAMRLLGEQFVTGRTIDEALERGAERETRGYRYSFDMLGEAAMTAADAERYYEDYEHAIHAIGNGSAKRGVVDGNGISVKLSALHPRYHWAQRERVMGELLPRLKQLCELARGYDIGLNIDAEEADRLDISLDLLEALVADPDLAGWDGIGFVVQAYQKRAPFVIDWIADLARREERRLMVRLVKGAYWDAEIKRAQIDGLEGYPVYTRKVYTDVSYLACAKKLLAARDVIYPQFATHNAHSMASIMHMAEGDYRKGDYEFQCLHGMGEPLYDQIVADPALSRLVRIYAPVGSHETLLAYLVRRLLENGANTSFVNLIVDENVPVEELVRDPVALAEPLAGSPHPRIPLPKDLYGQGRRNSRGFDLSSEPVRAAIAGALAASRKARHAAGPLVAGVVVAGSPQPVRNPADLEDIVGEVVEADLAEVEAALRAAEAGAHDWAVRSPVQRAECLERTADLLERDALALIALAVREAGKSWSNAIAELREAVDFCHYYAQQARELDNGLHQPLGPVLCISPWNFPLAIFTGQVAAALVAGNPVLAKPAEQTPLIAAWAVRLFCEAGVPEAAVQLLPGRGEIVGAALVRDARVRGVMFTGSTEVAMIINRTLAERGGDVPLIAETGGQNAMIVDSTALPEQVVGDVLASSFDSAGQRCSALRVLCLQEDIADRVIEMIEGATRELKVGNTADVRVDIGPVIDAEAQAGLARHIEAMRSGGAKLTQLPVPEACAKGTFIPPTMIEIDSLAQLQREVFGPVLHVLRFAARDLPRVVDEINASGYGLTLGIHSRIDETINDIVARAHVGNIYVNRNMIGAVVGVQPFGGEGRSGTGPKAGGPLYLHRLLRRSPGAEFTASVAVPNLFERFAGWVDEAGRALVEGDDTMALRVRAEAYRSHHLVDLRLALPGPTGEDNSLSFKPRGVVAAVAGSMAGYFHQLMAALATGNRVVLGDAALARKLVAALPADVAQRVSTDAKWFDGDFGALLFDGSDAQADAWRVRLARRDGPILPLVRPQPEYDLGRLVAERTVSINTAAAGGNASLMAMGN
ncbi:trifunctional transcriptional regulator/proline dehydrogenase/L-glutamate gamma-semialdehyde dehydrogenase [Azoarcus sp. DN11]|uniref:trifunctional transcriptional regulator/proline dehydrogenase/L-glutamate gamma-semialdehyde dehydrogenase n=1 Tax=Azoarcus sp. DN11 TaxID=356837 RepID=UPI000EB41F0B|nr:trifunctional transcriptional regulator/proline dehydrogenase/L-glutamate gamma-semialdehyde dehydrogenase [Azoarcus sp. DN11]AYH42682.1 trifunctional transcriptional regulator/proline dehydrogenase/L-glutamate gamma-semialdehyde dehydrogenase [Azoarcus sp. DN11]